MSKQSGALTDSNYWDSVWNGQSNRSRRAAAWKSLFLENPAERMFWRDLAASLPKPLTSVVEIGSAPGANLLKWKRKLGCDVFGVDFSEVGLRMQRELFAREGIDASHSISADFLNPEFQRRYGERFDIVCSAGLIEHFEDPEAAVKAHVKILRSGGLLVITIPNITGVYRRWMEPEVVAAHNLRIMKPETFKALFDLPELTPLLCGYYGQLNLGIPFRPNSALHKNLLRAQLLANFVLRFIPSPENSWTSPHLRYVGRKS